MAPTATLYRIPTLMSVPTIVDVKGMTAHIPTTDATAITGPILNTVLSAPAGVISSLVISLTMSAKP